LDPLTYAALGGVAFLAGGINAIAGGGTLIAFPALVAAGYSTKVANVTNTVALWPGTVGSSVAYRAELSRQRATVVTLLPPTVLGALSGSALLLATPDNTFKIIVPFLILGACALLAFQDQINARFYSPAMHEGKGRPLWALRVLIYFTAVYGGYFGGGLGIITLAIFGVFLTEDIQHANALKGLFAMAVNGLAAIYFSLFGHVVWEAALIMAACSLVGGYVGAHAARRMPRTRVRQVAVSYGTIAALYLLFRA
jgi:uncharacterized membrane protein YfcA